MSAVVSPIMAARAAVTAPAFRSIAARKVFGGKRSDGWCSKVAIMYMRYTLPRGVQLRPMARARASTRPSRRADRLVVRAEEEGGAPDLPGFLTDMMKPPDASITAPGWLAPLINLAEEAGESAPLVGYGIMGATGVFFTLFFAIAGFGGFGALLGLGGTGYACWQASPYLSAIGSQFDAAPTSDEEEE